MTGRRRTGLLVGLVVVVAGAACVHRASRPVRDVRRAVRLVSGVQLAAWYDPIWHALDAAYHAVVTPIRAVTSLIVGWVTDMIGALATGIDDVGQLVDVALQTIGSLADSVWTAITHITASLIPNLAAGLYNFVGSVVSVAVGQLTNLVTDARNLATGLWQNAIGEAHALFDNLYHVVASWVDGVRSWVVTSVVPWVQAIIRDAVGWVGPAIDTLRRDAGNLVAGVRGWVAPVVDLVNAARTWLLWLAAHPFDFWRGPLDELVSVSGRAFLDAFSRSLASEGDAVEQTLVRMLG